MRTFKFFWEAHKWVGIVGALFLINIAATGFLLLIKKKAAWIQAPLLEGAPGGVHDYAPLSEIYRALFALGHPDFKSEADIDRIDFRPGDRVHRVHSVHNYTEIQVCAVTARVMDIGVRRSDFFEQLHDGSWYAEWMHAYLMPLVAVSLLFLAGTGIYLWTRPLVRRRQIRRRVASAKVDS
jgi:uncharacterized iron-regulated membrane protein